MSWPRKVEKDRYQEDLSHRRPTDRGSAASCRAQTVKPRVADGGTKSAAAAKLGVASGMLRLGPKPRVEQKVLGLAANHAVLA